LQFRLPEKLLISSLLLKTCHSIQYLLERHKKSGEYNKLKIFNYSKALILLKGALNLVPAKHGTEKST
jgi:hypothetical protein